MCRKFDASICSNCGGVPLFGCVACPTPKSKWQKKAEKLQEELDEIRSKKE